jgi:DNA-binding NtrC family response regulator
VYLPPLRERRTDVPELIARFAAEFLGEGVTVDAAIERALQQHPFPGNVRELKGLVRAACARCPDGKTLRLACLPAPVLNNLAKAPAWSMSDLDVSAEGALVAGVTFNDFVDAAKDSLVRAALGLARGSVKEAAQRLSVSERCVQLRRRAERASGAPPAQEGDETLEVAS